MIPAAFVSAPDGLDMLAVVPPQADGFAPLQGTSAAISLRHMWSALPSDLEDLPPGDRARLERLWLGGLQLLSDCLTQLSTGHALHSLPRSPGLSVRKWVRFPLWVDAPPTRGGFVGIDGVGASTAAGAITLQDTSGSEAFYGPETGIAVPCTLAIDIKDARVRAAGAERWASLGFEGADGGVYLGVSSLQRMALVHRVGSAYHVSYAWGTIGATARFSAHPQGDGQTLLTVTSGTVTARALVPTGTYSRLVIREGLGTDTPLGTVVFSASGLRWGHSYVGRAVAAVPTLQTTPRGGPTLYDGVHYVLQDGCLSFADGELPEGVWAEHVASRTDYLAGYYGELVSTRWARTLEDCDASRSILAALDQGCVGGPFQATIVSAVAALVGVPVSEDTGKVTAVFPAWDGIVVEVTSDRYVKRYTIPPWSRVRVDVGADVEQGDVLGEVPTVNVDSVDLANLSVLRVEVPFGSYRSGLRADMEEYLRRVVGIWLSLASWRLSFQTRCADNLVLREAATMGGALRLRDALTNAPNPRYNTGRRYNTPGLQYDMGSVAMQEHVVAHFTNNSGDASTVVLGGVPTTIAPAGTITFEVLA